jgi:hypothetical protein
MRLVLVLKQHSDVPPKTSDIARRVFSARVACITVWVYRYYIERIDQSKCEIQYFRVKLHVNVSFWGEIIQTECQRLLW